MKKWATGSFDPNFFSAPRVMRRAASNFRRRSIRCTREKRPGRNGRCPERHDLWCQRRRLAWPFRWPQSCCGQGVFAQSSSFSKTKNVPGYTLFYYSGLTRWIRLRRRMRGRRDSNSQPQDRQSCALTNWATPPMPVTGLAPVTLGLWCPCSTIELHRPKFVAPVGVEPTAPAYETGEITVSPRRVVLLYYKKSGKSTP